MHVQVIKCLQVKMINEIEPNLKSGDVFQWPLSQKDSPHNKAERKMFVLGRVGWMFPLPFRSSVARLASNHLQKRLTLSTRSSF